MEKITGGSLEFEITGNADKLVNVLETAKRSIQGFSETTTTGGEDMEKAFEKAAETIEQAWKDIDYMSDIHRKSLEELEKTYKELGDRAGEAFMQGTAKGDEEYRRLVREQEEVGKLIDERRKLVVEINDTADALSKEEQVFNKLKEKVDKASNSKAKLTTQLRNITYEIAEMEEAGQRGSEAYKKLTDEAARLNNALQDARTQTRILSHDNAGLQGVISGVSGVTGAFSAAHGAIALFSGESENLQKIMLRVQSLMGITMGLQQVANVLNKDSAFQLTVVARAKNLLAAATTRLSAALGISTVAAQALMATLTLGLSLAITGVIALIAKFSSAARKAKKEQEELNKAISEMAGKPTASIQKLAGEYNQLTKSMRDKEEFVRNNKKAFEELGLTINTVADAERLLSDPANVQKFVNAQLAKARATAQLEKIMTKQQELEQKRLEYEQMPDTVSQFVQTSSFGGGYYQTAENIKKAKLKEEIDGLNADLQFGYLKVAQTEKEAAQMLDELNEESREAIKGSITYYRELIKDKTEAMEILTDPEAITAARKEIEELQATLNKIQGTAKTTTSKAKDPFIEQLEERKKKYDEYFKWVNSGDDIVQKAAQKEFAGLLEEGSSYLDYLKKQREQLTAAIGDDEATKRQREELRKLNTAIATETKDTVLAQFDTDLQAQLSTAENVLQMLDIIQKRRDELSGDGSDVDTGKSEILEKAQKEAAQQAETQTKELLEKYGDYLAEKLEFEADYAANSRLLNQQLEKAKTDKERQIAQEALKGLEADRLRYAKQTGSKEYDLLVEQYQSFQQRREAISKDYDDKIALATKNSNQQLVDQLTEERDRKLSRVALEELQDTEAWTQILGNLDDLTTEQLNRLIQQIEAQRATLGVELDPADLQTILDKIEAARDIVRERNPFKALAQAVKDYGKEVEGQSRKKDLNRIFEGIAGSIDLVKGTFDSVVDGLSEMGVTGDDVTQKLLGDISNLMGSAGQLAKGLVSGNPMEIIQGGIGVITNAFKVFNKQDRDAERALIKHANAVQALEKEYRNLERAVDKALGESVYKNQQALISNLQQQRYHMQQMWMAEERKKRSNKDKIRGYKEQYQELGYQIEDTIAGIAESITQTSARSMAQQLADSIAEVFASGFDSSAVAGAIEDVTNNVMRNAVKNALKLQFLEAPMKAAVDQLQKSMGFDETGAGSFDGLSPSEQQAFKDRVSGIASTYSEAMKMYSDLFRELEDESPDDPTSLSGAIKGASQESINLLAGQTNAMRINQVEGNTIMREQLLHLASIDRGIGISNELLSGIYNALKTRDYDTLRAQGIMM